MYNHESDKDKIRKRYKGLNPDEIDLIPAAPKENFFENNGVTRRVAVYARVSTGDPNQTSSYELQKNHYLDMVNRHPDWELVKIYADEGISGTSLEHRDAFIEMINDCCEHKIDMILTKSVSRFARNVVDCIGYVRKLKSLTPPVAVLFEAENIFTFDSDSEMRLSFMATVAQEESHNKSEVMNASIEMRFRRGIFLTPPLLGYDQDQDGNLIINEKEASIVRLIFFMYLYGYTCCQIAETLTRLGCKTKKDNTVWSPGSILQILQNERHCGSVLARKTFTPDYLTHKSKKNRNDRNQYRHKNNHEAIISREDFIAVQHFISNAKYGNKRILPELKAITQGVLTGFVTVHPTWGGFACKDYICVSEKTYNPGLCADTESNILSNSEFDLSGYQIARSQFFNVAGKTYMTLSKEHIQFSSGCICKFENTQFVEMLVHPGKKLFAVRPSSKNNNLSVKWFKQNDIIIPRPISGAAFLPVMYDLLNLNFPQKYRVHGTYYNYDNTPVIIFDITDAEILMTTDNVKITPAENSKPLSVSGKHIIGCPTGWIEDFGHGFYTHAQARELEHFIKTGVWAADSEGDSYMQEDMPAIISKSNMENKINQIMNEIKKGDAHGRNED